MCFSHHSLAVSTVKGSHLGEVTGALQDSSHENNTLVLVLKFKKIIGMAKIIFNIMKIMLTSNEINRALKMRIIKCMYSSLLCGAESRTLNKQFENRTDEMWMHRRIG